MTTLSEKADRGPRVVLAGDLVESQYSHDVEELMNADELTPEGEFPQYGDFLPVEERSQMDGTFRGECYVEVPAALAEWLVENTEPGDWWQVRAAEKVEGEWQVEAENVTRDDSQESLEGSADSD